MKKILLVLLFTPLLFSACSTSYYKYKMGNELTAEERETRIKEMRSQGISEGHIKAILNGDVKVGFTYEEVVWAFGYPQETNRTVYEDGEHLQCIYYYVSPYRDVYLYFDNGILTAFQD